MSLTGEERLAESAAKIRPPFQLDPTLRFYSPQENLEALDHPRVAAWHDYVRHRWQPPPDPAGCHRIALLIPCTKYKPYSTSREHRAINRALLDAGWEPAGGSSVPAGLEAVLDPGESAALLHEGPLRRGKAILDRFVMSEPMALVPYEHIYYWEGAQSPAASYDDPGLFEARGTSVSPSRADCTARPVGNGKWRWGPAERQAYVDMHNRLVEIITATLQRLAPRYRAIGAWVSPRLTHRSFLADIELRRAEGIPQSRRGVSGPARLAGVLDAAPGLVTVMPTAGQLEEARRRLAQRLRRQQRPATAAAVQAVYARGDGNDTPLGLAEALVFLVAWLAEQGA